MIPEREMSTDEARARLNNLCAHLGLKPELALRGAEQLVATCSLYDSDHRPVSVGAGKGDQCLLGALAESLEHYMTEHVRFSQVELAKSSELVKSAALADDWLVQAISNDCWIPVYTLQCANSDERVNLPAVLLSPNEETLSDTAQNPDLAFLTKYSTNSGTALGCTENEAFLHALNEAIERHALSVFFMSICGFGPFLKLSKPSSTFIQETFKAHPHLIDEAEHLTIHMTQDFYQGYFCIALPTSDSTSELSIIGSGFSCDPSVALYRAVTEQIQCATLQSPEDYEQDHSAIELLSSSAKLLHPLPDQAAPFQHPERTTLSVREQLRQTLWALRRSRRRVFYRTLLNAPGLACAVQLYIPGHERFHLIRAGCPVAPQSVLSKGVRPTHVYL